MSDFENETLNDETGPVETLVYALAAAPGLVPGQSGVVLAALNSGLLRSEDGGQTWQDALSALPISEPIPVTSLVTSPDFDHDHSLFAGAPGGVFRSTDGGNNWRALVFPAPPPTVSALAVSPNYAQDETLFAGTMEDGVFISQNGGDRWVAWNFGLLDLNVMALAISPNFAEDETVFAGTETGIFRSTNGGRAWKEVELPFGFDAVLCLVFSPDYARDHTVFAGTESQGLWRSADDGESWSRLAEGIIDDPVNTLILAEGALLAVTSLGLFRSTDGGQTWDSCLPMDEDGSEISAVYAPQGIQPGASLLVAFTDGTIQARALD